jgi:hypothetical protein
MDVLSQEASEVIDWLSNSSDTNPVEISGRSLNIVLRYQNQQLDREPIIKYNTFVPYLCIYSAFLF